MKRLLFALGLLVSIASLARGAASDKVSFRIYNEKPAVVIPLLARWRDEAIRTDPAVLKLRRGVTSEGNALPKAEAIEQLERALAVAGVVLVREDGVLHARVATPPAKPTPPAREP